MDVLIKFAVFWGKVVGFMFFYMWVRWTLPRFRFDQLMNLAWRGMIPVSLAALLMTAVVVYLQKAIDLQHASLWILIGNGVLFVIALAVIAPAADGAEQAQCRCRIAATIRSLRVRSRRRRRSMRRFDVGSGFVGAKAQSGDAIAGLFEMMPYSIGAVVGGIAFFRMSRVTFSNFKSPASVITKSFARRHARCAR